VRSPHHSATITAALHASIDDRAGGGGELAGQMADTAGWVATFDRVLGNLPFSIIWTEDLANDWRLIGAPGVTIAPPSPRIDYGLDWRSQ
jgi:hypothetical protein